MAAPLDAHLSDEFLKIFLPETLYLLPEDKAAPHALAASHAPADEVAEAQPTPAPRVHQTPDIPKTAEPEKTAPTGKYQVIGANKKGVIVLVTVPDAAFKALPKVGFLQKILAAIGLHTDDVAYLNNVSGAVARFEDLRQEMEVNYIISFASRLDTDLPHEKFTLYNPVKVDSVPVVFSLALDKLEHDVEQKGQLWTALQKVFLG